MVVERIMEVGVNLVVAVVVDVHSMVATALVMVAVEEVMNKLVEEAKVKEVVVAVSKLAAGVREAAVEESKLEVGAKEGEVVVSKLVVEVKEVEAAVSKLAVEVMVSKLVKEVEVEVSKLGEEVEVVVRKQGEEVKVVVVVETREPQQEEKEPATVVKVEEEVAKREQKVYI